MYFAIDLVSVVFLFAGCCTNVFYLEHLFKDVRSASLLLTFAQFVFVVFIGLVRGDFRKNEAPLKRWASQGWLLLIVNCFNHLALAYEVPMPIHILFRSSSIIMSMILSIFVLKRRYSLQSYLAVFMISFGVMLSTVGSIPASFSSPSFIGMVLLTLSLILGAFLGLYQEQTFLLFPKSTWQSSLFYSHLCALPFFVFVSGSLSKEIVAFSSSSYTWIEWIPDTWILLLLNTTSQYVCIAAVHKLASFTSSLTMTLVLTLRKCISLAISIWYFRNTFLVSHFCGAVLVSLGTLMYARSMRKKVQKIKRPKEKVS